MLEYVHEVRKNLESALRHIEDQAQPVLKKAEEAIFCINDSLKIIKQYVSSHQFQSQEEEILFFKKIKPSIYSRFIYFAKVFNIESKRPECSNKSERKYLLNELSKLESFFTENIEFYQYTRSDMTYLDDKYFVRGKLDVRLLIDTSIYDLDPVFSTGYDYKVAQIMANNLLGTYLKTEIKTLIRKEFIYSKQGAFSKGKYVWTAHKNSLVELIYAFRAGKAINDGDFDIIEMALFFEAFFSIEIGDIYRTFLEIKGRNNLTKFLDSLKQALIDDVNKEFK